MLDSNSFIAIAITALLLLAYGGSVLYHSLRVDVHTYYKYVKYDNKTIYDARLISLQNALRLIRLLAECYNLYQIVFLCSHTEYVKRHFYEMKHPGGHEDKVWRIMITWWGLVILELIANTTVQLYATTRDTIPSFAEQLSLVVLVVERTVTVFGLNCPDANVRIGTNTIASIILLVTSLIMKTSRFTSERSRLLVFLGRIVVFTIGIANAGVIIFMNIIERVIETKTGTVTARAPADDALLLYAYFQATIVSLVFILQLVAHCTTTTTNKPEEQPQTKQD